MESERICILGDNSCNKILESKARYRMCETSVFLEYGLTRIEVEMRAHSCIHCGTIVSNFLCLKSMIMCHLV